MLALQTDFIKFAWFLLGILLMFICFFKNSRVTRYISYVLFLCFIFVSSLRSVNFNPDIHNYIMHFQSLKTSSFALNIFVAWLFEPGYNLIVFFLTRFCDEKMFLFFITFLPGLLFTYTFKKYKYPSQIVFFIYATIILVAGTTTMRHFWAMAVAFWVLNQVLVANHSKPIWLYFLPGLFHFAAFPLSGVLVLDRYKSNFSLKRILIIALFIMCLMLLLKPFWSIIIGKLIDRTISLHDIRGVRNILNLFIVVLLSFIVHKNFTKISIKPARIDFLLKIVILISMLLLPFPGINRITSFFVLILCFYFWRYYGNNNLKKSINIKHILLNFYSYLSLFYFYYFWC